MHTATLKLAIHIGMAMFFDGHRLIAVAMAYSTIAARYGSLSRGTSNE